MQNWKFALSSIWGHKMRAFLTMLGIIIGVASVVVIMALGNGMKAGVTGTLTKDQQYVSLFYNPKKGDYISGVNLNGSADSDEDISNSTVEPPKIQEAWIKELTKIKGIDGYYVSNNTKADFSSRNKKANNVDITGVNATFFKMGGYKLVTGRWLSPADYQNFSRVVMLDEPLAQKLYGGIRNSLNQIVTLGETSYRVVGVFKNPNAGTSVLGASSGGTAIMANTQLASEFNVDEIQTPYIHVAEPEQIKNVGVEAAKQLTKLSGVPEGQFQIFNLDKVLGQINTIVSMMTGVVGAIAGISLLVGGIGVMNIMLVSVTERTREIGLRKALGATRGNILTQFLIESMVLTMIGGLIGLGLAYGLNTLIGAVAGKSLGGPPTVSPLVAIGSIAFSAAVGIVFGILPANKASKLDPIEALRYE
ncbi:ABC transporter permease [Streptococcus oricebi]|uniref:ABC transporter permease n=1 Tax=Streptococcus oricebi TaxID=1547447 RepID=A0ABS5B2A0_9STRE|nr:ABC transporter permease [Streptococcus oricebi]MBP2622948.1 hypothetical protein [Streptococcus oricebi]